MSVAAPQPAPAKARTLAGLVDCAIVAGYVVVLGMVIALVFPLLTGPTPLWAAALMALLFIEAPVGVWWWRQESSAGTTIGKRLYHLQVARFGGDEPASGVRCAVRTVVKLLPWAIAHVLILVAADPASADQWWWSVPALCLVATLGIASILTGFFRIDQRAAYDIAAGTQVVVGRRLD